MSEFLQSYGTWIVAGLFFLLMLSMHARGHGHAGHDTGVTLNERGTDPGAGETPVDGARAGRMRGQQ